MPIRKRWLPIPEMPRSLTVADSELGATPGVRLRACLKVIKGYREGRPTSDCRGKAAILFGSDTSLGRLTQDAGVAPAALARAGFAVVIGPGYSTWINEAPFASRVSIARTAQAAARLSTWCPTIPAIVWRYREDLDLWAWWIAQNNLAWVSIDLGTFRSKDAWHWATENIRRLRERTASLIELPGLAVSGPSTTERIADVYRAWSDRVTVISQRPSRLARSGRLLLSDLTSTRAEASFDRYQLLQMNVDTFDYAVQRAGRLSLNA